MTDETSAPPVASDQDTDTPLQSAVWLAQDIGIVMPPVPGIHADGLEEVALGRLFATDRAILALDSPGSIAEAAGSGWPRRGVAFGFVARGLGGRWFYTLTSERVILHVSLRLPSYPEGSAAAAADEVSAAHAALERYLSDEAHYQSAISIDPPAGGAPRHIICFSDQDGVAAEVHASFSADGELSAFAERHEIFGEASSTVPDMTETILWV